MSCLHGKEWETSLQGMRRMNVQWGLLGTLTVLLLAATVGGCTWGDPGDSDYSYFDLVCRYGDSHSEPFVHWTPDGEWLVVDDTRLIRRVAADGTWAQTVTNPNPRYHDPSLDPEETAHFNYGYYADVSPVNSRIVFTSCESPIEDYDNGRVFRRNYELFTIGIDGTDARRLTSTTVLENFPVWSPDGTRIAFLQSPEEPDVYSPAPVLWELYVMAADGTDRRWLTKGVGLFPPVWSPDGRRLAYISDQETGPRSLGRVEVVDVDTWQVTRIGATSAVPAWSPDGRELALGSMDEGGPAVLAVGTDGSGMHTVWASEAGADAAPVTQLAWSPDGTALVFVTDQVFIINPIAGDPRRLIKPMGKVQWPSCRLEPRRFSPCPL